MISPYHILLSCLYYLLSLLHLLLWLISPYLFLIVFLTVICLSGLFYAWSDKYINLCLILWKQFQSMTSSVATVMINVFLKNEINLLRKFGKIMRIFDKIDNSKSRG